MIDCQYHTTRTLHWFKKYLIKEADLTMSVLEEHFADPFMLRFNGLVYDNMSLGVHLTNLNLYRSNIVKINYKVIDSFYLDDRSMVALSVKTIRQRQEPVFNDMMLRLRFDEDGLIVLWHQSVYPVIQTTENAAAAN